MKKNYLILPLLIPIMACSNKVHDITNAEIGTGVTSEVTRIKQPKQDRVFFSFDSAILDDKAKNTLNETVVWLKSNSNIKIAIEGHCDEKGTRDYNLVLGQKRADAVKRYLVSKGINSSRIKTISYGKEMPAVIGKGKDVWSKNRRSVIVVINN